MVEKRVDFRPVGRKADGAEEPHEVGRQGYGPMSFNAGLARKVAPLLGALLVVQWAVAGCAPAERPLLAVERLENGGTRLLLARCSHARYSSLSIHETQRQPSRRWALQGETPAASLPEQIDLFTAPVGFIVKEGALAELTDSGGYTVVTSALVEVQGVIDGRLRFTPEKLEKLETGKVLTGRKGETVMDRSRFLKPSASQCKK
ncbi:hypothetical protein [Streptomyces erythrochromogenes]|uniref:hypothetical protein n=1 Tax=Streptomyces erythrochromogenes TaxID=285574 RepID=UPI00381A2013